MGHFDYIHGVASKIGELSKRLKNNAIAQAKQFDGPAWWSIAGELSKEIVLKTVPGAKWIWKSVRKIQNSGCSFDELKYIRERICRLASENSSLKEMKERVSRLESENASSKEMTKRVSRLESENLSLKETSERISLLEFEISSMREKMNELQQERIMLLASMLTLATHAEMKSWKTRATLLTVSDLFLPSDHFIISVEAKREDCIQPCKFETFATELRLLSTNTWRNIIGSMRIANGFIGWGEQCLLTPSPQWKTPPT